MVSADPFAVLVPAILLVLGAVILIASRWGSRAAPYWGAGLLLSAAGFTAPLLPLPNRGQAMVGEALFLFAFFLYGHGLLVRLLRPRLVLPRLAFVLLAYGCIAFATLVADSLHAELLLSDSACALLLLWPLAQVRRHLSNSIDRLLFAVLSLAAVDSLARVALLGSLIAAGSRIEDYYSSPYALWAQATAAIIATLFAITVLGTVAADIIDRYRHAAERDPLTGLLNRRGFAVAHSCPPVAMAAVIHCDIDHFKRVNDAHGHAAGDSILVSFATMLETRLPTGGRAARFGGEEFVLLLPGASPEQAAALAELIREDLARHDWRALGITQGITASFGVAGFAPSVTSIEDAVARADAALYLAKAEGRNRVMLDVATAGQRTGGGPVRVVAPST